MVDATSKILDNLTRNKPTIIVDADEVLLQFVVGLEQYFPTKGYELRLESFQLFGNIYETSSNRLADQGEVKKLLGSFFDECVDDIPAVEGAATALEELSQEYQVVILSNVPSHCRERRAASLAALNMAYPVIANRGEKGPLVSQITERTGSTAVFIDDLPPHHTSVAQHSPDTHRIHFIADKRLSSMLPKAPDAHFRLHNWQEITQKLSNFL